MISLFFAAASLRATHTMGADITYTCIGSGKYAITLTFFRDCAGILPATAQQISYSSATCNVNSVTNLTQPYASVDVTPLCPSQLSACEGGATSFGIQQYTYTGIIQLPVGCGNDWILGWTDCCRNYAITTLSAPGNQSTYLSARLNNTITPCNNSPVFNNIPTPIVCVNQPVTYNHGVTDPDGDQLVFSLTSCQQGSGVSVGYASGYSATTPLASASPITIDPVTGQITFTPNQIQIGVICVKVEEYRGGIKIGETVRDMQFSVINCTNTPPVASGINGNSTDFDISICVNGPLCFDIIMQDADADNITATWNNGIPGGTFTVTGNGTQSPAAEFCWTPTASDLGVNFFTVTVTDDNCPLSGSATYAFTVNVSNTSNALTASADQTICEGGSVNLTSFGFGAISYTWTPSLGLSNPNISNPTASPPVTTTYTVTADYSNGCSADEFVTVTVENTPSVSISPAVSYACPGSTVALTSNAPGATSYSWNTGATTANLSVTPVATTTYTLTASTAAGCDATATATVNVNTPGTNSCSVIYASPTGTGSGTAASPASLTTALSLASCTDVVIKLDIGTYVINNTITNVSNNMTLEGGFDRLNGWRKTSLAGATTIRRSTLNPEGAANAQRLVAFQISNASNFRFQDLTISTDNAVTDGCSTYGVHLTNCSNYQFVRCQILPGAARKGADGTPGTNGVNGGNGVIGTNGHYDNNTPGPNSRGTGGLGGGGGTGGGGAAGGTGGIDPNGANVCCNTGGDGTNGTVGATLRTGGSGGGGGAGADGGTGTNGGDGGTGGSGGGGAFALAGGNGGLTGNGEVNGQGNSQDGTDGNNGNNGNNGAAGAAGAAGTHTGGFWVPGAVAGTGADGAGGAGGSGGGGGGGQWGSAMLAVYQGSGNGAGGGGGGGQGGTGGTGGRGGGSSYAAYLFNNGTGGQFTQCRLVAGTAGAGGTGGAGGSGGNGGTGGLGSSYTSIEIGESGNGGDGGDGGNGGTGGTGAAGQSIALHQNGGTAPNATGPNTTFNLAGQPTIRMDNISCVNTNVTCYSAASNLWNLGTGASPQIVTAQNPVTSYSSIGRKDIEYAGNIYEDFGNIILNDALLPDAATTAPLVSGVYRICAGSAVDFAALNAQSGNIISWDLDGGATPGTYSGTTYSSLTNVTFTTPGTYDIQLRYQTDCCGLSDPDTITLIVDPQPALVLSGPAAFCAGTGGVTLTASGGNSYDWQPSAGLSSTAGTSVIANPTTTTQYTVVAYNTEGTCYDVATQTVTVNDLIVNGNTTNAGCLPTGTATVVTTGGSGNYAYLWSTAPVQTTATATNLPNGGYQVRVTDNITGCKDSTQLTVNKTPGTLSAWVNAATTPTCNGGTNGQASIATSGAVGTLSYAWSPAGGTAASATGLAPGNYSVQVTDNTNGCQTTATVQIGNPDPVLVSLQGQTTSNCTDFATATVSGDGGNGPYTFSWNTVPVQTGNTATGLTPGTYTVTATDQTGCPGTMAVVVPGTQSPVSLSLVNIIPGTACYTNDAGATVIASGSGGSITYEWQTTPPVFGPTISNVIPDFYTVTATGSNGCTDVLGVNIGPVCPLDVEWLGLEATPAGNHIRLGWVVQADGEVAGYQLLRSEDGTTFDPIGWIPSSGQEAQLATYSFEDHAAVPGVRYWYQVILIDVQGASSPSARRSATLPVQGPGSVLVYPVPTSGLVYLDLTLPEAGLCDITLHNSLGQTVYAMTAPVRQGLQTLTLDLHTLADGVYTGRLTTGGYVWAFRVVKHR
ncbi:MAG: T9SS type A sorting domain-containing protein [Bacteroidia bacterium]|nr:T9SS type A sorting domain-containing protein [Bacteroidia bacterium]